MTVLHGMLLLLHLLAMATLVGGFSAQLSSRERRITPGQWHGALLALASGLALVALAELRVDAEDSLNHAKVAVKLTLGVALVVLTSIGKSRQSWLQGWLSTGLLAISNTAVAVLW